MSSNLADLVILSIVARKNVAYTDIISVVKDIASEYWSPTGDVLCEAVEDLISKSFLEIQHSALNGECLQITKTGLEEFSSLLLRLRDRDTEIRYSRLLELVQLRSLDLVPATVARIITVTTAATTTGAAMGAIATTVVVAAVARILRMSQEY